MEKQSGQVDFHPGKLILWLLVRIDELRWILKLYTVELRFIMFLLEKCDVLLLVCLSCSSSSFATWLFSLRRIFSNSSLLFVFSRSLKERNSMTSYKQGIPPNGYDVINSSLLFIFSRSLKKRHSMTSYKQGIPLNELLWRHYLQPPVRLL